MSIFDTLTQGARNFVANQLGGTSKPANATLTVRAVTGAGSVDTATGNYLPTTAEVELSVFLKSDRSSRAKDVTYYPGIDEQSEPLMGRLIDPKPWPDGVNRLTRGTITWGERTGTCQINCPIQSAFGSNEFLGDKIYVTVKWQV